MRDVLVTRGLCHRVDSFRECIVSVSHVSGPIGCEYTNRSRLWRPYS